MSLSIEKTFRAASLMLAAGLLVGCYSNTITSDRQIIKDGWLSSHANVRVVRETKVTDDLMRVDV